MELTKPSCRKDNEKDLPDIPENIRNEMKLHFVESMDEVLKIALEREIVALPMPATPRCGSRCPAGRSGRALSSRGAGHRLVACGESVGRPSFSGLPRLRGSHRLVARKFVIAAFVTSSAKPEQFPSDGLPEIAFLGRSNVGKSSLINALAGRKGLAFTSSTPGRTQTINFYRIDGSLYFVDLPGYGYARVPKELAGQWKELIESYLLTRRNSGSFLSDPGCPPGLDGQDLQLKQWLESHNRRYLVIATKTDKLNQSEQWQGLARIRKENVEPLPFSASTGRGVREIWQAITKTLQTR